MENIWYLWIIEWLLSWYKFWKLWDGIIKLCCSQKQRKKVESYRHWLFDSLSFSWQCKRNYSHPLLYELTAKNESLKVLAETSNGCFNQSPGKLSQTSGTFTGATTRMLPFTFYILALEISKDTRKANFTQEFMVAASDPPVLSLR